MPNTHSDEELPAIGWRLLSAYTYEGPTPAYRKGGFGEDFSVRVKGETHTALASLTRPNVVWSATGPLTGWMEQREFQAECRPKRWSYYQSQTVKDKRAKKAYTDPGHLVPSVGCKCGFACYHDYDDMVDDLVHEAPLFFTHSQIGRMDEGYRLMDASEIWPGGESYVLLAKPPSTILALAWGFGEVIAYDTNFRSEFMSLAALCNEGDLLGGVAREHAALLGIPTMTKEEMKDYAAYAGRSLAP